MSGNDALIIKTRVRYTIIWTFTQVNPKLGQSYINWLTPPFPPGTHLRGPWPFQTHPLQCSNDYIFQLTWRYISISVFALVFRAPGLIHAHGGIFAVELLELRQERPAAQAVLQQEHGLRQGVAAGQLDGGVPVVHGHVGDVLIRRLLLLVGLIHRCKTPLKFLPYFFQ